MVEFATIKWKYIELYMKLFTLYNKTIEMKMIKHELKIKNPLINEIKFNLRKLKLSIHKYLCIDNFAFLCIIVLYILSGGFRHVE